jgi:hypothetical protein
MAGKRRRSNRALDREAQPELAVRGGNGFHLDSLPQLYAAGFSGFETFSYDMDVAYSAEAWRGRIRASAGVGASLAPAEVQAFDAELARLLEESFPGNVLRVPHRVFAIIGTHAPASQPGAAAGPGSASERSQREPT